MPDHLDLRPQASLRGPLVGTVAAVCLSGFAALAYQVVWTRQLISITSATASAQAVMLAVFMAGLALGSHLAGTFSGRLRRPLWGYALVESAAALLAVLAVPLIRTSGTLVPALASAGGADAYWIQLALVALYLLLPTTLMGMSLPLLIEYLDRRAGEQARSRRGWSVGLVYGFNTMGAAVGTLMAGYVTLELWGLTWTCVLGAGLAGGAAAVAALVQRCAPAGPARTEEPGAESSERIGPRLLLVASLGGFVGLAAEVVWTRLVAGLVLNTVYAFTQVLVAVLVGIAAGGYLAAAVTRSAGPDPRQRGQVVGILITLQALAAVLICTVPALMVFLAYDDVFVADLASGFSLRSTLILFAVLAPPAALTACVLPLAATIAREFRGARAFGHLYAANTLGCVIGALVAGFVLLPLLGARASMAVVAAASLGIGLALVAEVPRRTKPLAVLGVAAMLSVVLVAAIDVPRGIYAARLTDGTRIRELREGVTSDVMITDDAQGHRRIWINSVWVAGTGGRHLLLGHLPALFVNHPRRALGIALGTGQTFSSAFKHGYQAFDCVEINADVIDLSREWFGAFTGNFLDDPRVHIHVGDGRAFLRSTDRTYDLIVIEPLQAWSAGTYNLYTREFYQEARRVLAPGGVVAQWLPFYGQTVDDTRAMALAGLEVFPAASLWQDLNDGILLFHDRPLSLSPDALERRIRERGIDVELARNDVAAVQDLLSLFLLGPRGLSAWTQGAPRLVDDHPFLDFSAARSIGSDSFVPIMRSLAPLLDDFAVYAGSPSAEDRAILERAAAIRRTFVEVSLLRDTRRYEERVALLEAGLDAQPASARLCTRFRAEILMWVQHVKAHRPELEETLLLRGLRRDPEFGEAAYLLALLVAQQGRVEEAAGLARRYGHIERTASLMQGLLRRLGDNPEAP